MKARAFLAATAMLVTSFNPLLVAPAFASPPINDTTGLTPQEVCEANLKPNDPNSDFQTYPTNESGGDWVNDGLPIQGDAVGDPEGYGTPTYSNVFLNNSYFRNGGSPNVWALAQATITYPQTRQLFSFTQHQTRTTTFDCYVFKIVGHDTLVDPAGLQSVGNSSVEEQTIDLPDQYVITDDDFIIEGATVHALICISPNNVTKGKPGTWTGKNGFLAANCPAASIAAGGTVPSDNAPNI
jgi:hypothetical protein